MTGMIRRMRERMIRLIYPHDAACLICSGEADVAPGYGICRTCSARLPRVRGELKTGDNRAFDAQASPFYYETPLKELIHRFKYSNQRYIAKGLAHYMADAVREAGWPALHAVVPVPLHEARRSERGFNQASLLASEIAQLLEIDLDREALVRVRQTKTQTLLDRAERERNVQNAFAVPETARIEGATLLLVDDVVTTGTTADACAKALKAAGAKAVYAVSACTRTIE